MYPNEIPEGRWQTVAMDFVTGLPPVGPSKYDAVLTVVDRFTKRVVFIPTHKSVTAQQTADLFLSHVVRHFGVPEKIISDRDPRFVSTFWQTLLRKLGVEPAMSTAHHPQTDGQSEVMNRQLCQMIRAYAESRASDWARKLPQLEFAVNDSVNRNTKLTPFFADLGRHPRGVLDAVLRPASADDGRDEQASDDRAERLILELRKIADFVADNLQEANQRMAGRPRDVTPKFDVGDYVLVSTKVLTTEAERERHDRAKVRAPYIGPFRVIDVVHPNAFRIELPVGSRAHDVVNVSHLKAFRGDPHTAQSGRPTVVLDAQTGEAVTEYEVEKILDKRRKGRGSQYLVRWKGASAMQDTWEPASSLANAPQAIEEFEDELRSKRGQVL